MMKFTETGLIGAYVVEPEFKDDERGSFFRTWCERQFREQGLDSKFVQASGVYNKRKGTLRGMHWQTSPHEETKLIRVTAGAVYDVIVDIRPWSSTFKKWFSTELDAKSRRMLFVPPGFAHGYLTLQDGTELCYQMSEFYAPDFARGFRWNDPAFCIQWPDQVDVISERDRSYPDFAA